ncbi:MAG: signal peptidase I [Planctomycetaceae bacterium]|nr:signal peptidase I [Planctomycetaceae bacterium]
MTRKTRKRGLMPHLSEGDVSPPPEKSTRQDGTRDTVEAVVIAFVLAFLFKTFEAEMFVIPTGSMAPTLYGRQKEIHCDGCGYDYDLGASQELDQSSGRLIHRIRQSVCPNCRKWNQVEHASVFNGDRIVVNKQVAHFQRFDVVVFKNPEEPQVSYIKRLVGLPGETLRIRQGDLYTRRSEDEPWRIQRKEDPEKQRRIQIPVYDDQFPPTELLEAGAEERWVAGVPDSSANQNGYWSEANNTWKRQENRSFTSDGSNSELEWLRYRHLVPASNSWHNATGPVGSDTMRAELIGDFCGYNPDINHEYSTLWVGDLTIQADVEIESAQPDSELVFELVKSFYNYRCRLDPSSGKLELISLNRRLDSENPVEEVHATAQTPIKGSGKWSVEFANVDDRLLVWIDGDLVQLSQPVEMDRTDLQLPTNADLAPVGIAARNVASRISGLRILRDIYYRTEPFGPQRNTSHQHPEESSAWQYMHAPDDYSRVYAAWYDSYMRDFGGIRDYALADDEYLMFGDNSPASKDSRLFDYSSRPYRGIGSHWYAVRQQDLIGEAMFIFWPHGKPFLNGGNGFTIMNHRNTGGEKVDDYPLYRAPFYPNISRMKWIY